MPVVIHETIFHANFWHVDEADYSFDPSNNLDPAARHLLVRPSFFNHSVTKNEAKLHQNAIILRNLLLQI